MPLQSCLTSIFGHICKINSCIDQICSFNKIAAAPAVPAARLSWLLAMLIILLSAAIVYMLIIVSKKLKKPRIHPVVKERIKISIPMNKKKSRLDRFTDNVSGYLSSMKSEKTVKKDAPKGLLNKNSFKKEEHPVKDFMLSNLKEVYDD